MAYNRYFEGRGHVGKMVHTVRELARGLSTYVKGDDQQTQDRRANISRLIAAYLVALRLSVRKIEGQEDARAELASFLTTSEMEKLKAVKKNFVLVIVKWIGDEVALFKGQLLFDRAMDFMEKNCSDLIESWMGMHKLATTQMPFPYVQMLYALLYGWMFTIGFPLAVAFGPIGIPGTTLLGYALFGINAIGQELEDPFGDETNDLPLEFFEKACKSACKLMLPKALVPEALEPGGNGTGNGSLSKVPSAMGQAPGAALSIATSPTSMNGQGSGNIMAELHSAVDFNGLSADMQVLFTQYFDRYDLNGNGILDEKKELTQLVTNLVFALKLGAHLPKLLEVVEGVQEPFSWQVPQFVEWFLLQCKSLGASS